MDLSTLHRFHIAPGFDPSAPDTWVWEDRSADVRDEVGVTITGGRGDEVSEVEAGSAALEVDNAGGHYCTRNPLGRWYGRLARNCPARWGTISGAEAFTANTSNGWGVPDVGISWTLDGSANLWSSSGGVGQVSMTVPNTANSAFLVGADARNGDATFAFVSGVVATGAALTYNLQARFTSSNDHLMFSIELGLSGVVTAKIRRQFGGTLTDLVTVVAGFTYSAGQRLKARCVWDGQDLRLRVWPEASGEPSTWTATATDSQCAGSGVALRAWRFFGNTNAGAVVFSFDDLEIEAVEIVGTIPTFPVRWDPTGTVSWAPIEISGITRRLAQGQQSLRSPMYRNITGYTRLVGYWPIEDGSQATQLANAVPGGAPGSVIGMSLGNPGPAGSAAAATFLNTSDTSRINGVFKSASSTAGWQISWTVKLPALPSSLTQELAWFTSNGYWWMVNLNTGVYNLKVVDGTGSVLTDTNVGFAGQDPPNQWTTIRMKATVSAGTVTAEFAWFAQGAPTVWGTTVTFSGTVGALKSWTANGNATMQNASFCQVFGVTTGLDNLQSFNALRAFDGYVAESAADRVDRLCGEEGVLVAVEPGDSEAMGVQPIGGLLDLLRECEAADQGVLYEAGAAVGYRPHGARQNRPVTMALTIAANGDIGDDPPPEPIDDDLRIRNEWTLSRPGGSEATASDPVHIALNDRYPDQAEVNVVADDRLSDHANWRVHLGTWPEMRWPQITLILTDRPTLLTAWRGRPFGPRITITGVPGQGPIGADVDLIVEGWSQQITAASWTVTLNCSPARPWDVAVIDASTSLKDSDSTTLSGSLSSGATTIGISTVNPQETWSTAGGYDLAAAGEVIGVPLGGMSAASGTGPFTQTITGAVRAKNGIPKTHVAGEPISLARPVFKAL